MMKKAAFQRPFSCLDICDFSTEAASAKCAGARASEEHGAATAAALTRKHSPKKRHLTQVTARDQQVVAVNHFRVPFATQSGLDFMPFGAA